MDALYTEEERLLWNTMREFADAELASERFPGGMRTRSSLGRASRP